MRDKKTIPEVKGSFSSNWLRVITSECWLVCSFIEDKIQTRRHVRQEDHIRVKDSLSSIRIGCLLALSITTRLLVCSFHRTQSSNETRRDPWEQEDHKERFSQFEYWLVCACLLSQNNATVGCSIEHKIQTRRETEERNNKLYQWKVLSVRILVDFCFLARSSHNEIECLFGWFEHQIARGEKHKVRIGLLLYESWLLKLQDERNQRKREQGLSIRIGRF